MKLYGFPAKLMLVAASAVIALAPWDARAGSVKPTVTWDDTTEVVGPPVGSGFITFTAFGPAPGDPREQAGFTGTFFSTVDAETFGTVPPDNSYGPASVWLVEPGPGNVLSDWIGIDKLSRVPVDVGANGVNGVNQALGWIYTIDMRFVSDPIEGAGGANNIPDPPTTPPFDPYPFVTETGALQDITGNFTLTNFPGYRGPSGLTDLLSIFVASDVDEAPNGGNGNATPDAGTTAMLLAVGLGALAIMRHRLGTIRFS